jgi:hypothetical protein
MYIQLAVRGKLDSRGGWIPQIVLEENNIVWAGDRLFDSEYEARAVAMNHLTSKLEFLLK